jgi:hypothetical protein
VFERFLELFREPPSEPVGDTSAADDATAAELAALLKQWEVVVGVQKHFNELEWRIRSLALTALTAIVGFAVGTSVAEKFITLCSFKIGFSAFLGALGAAIWTAFFMSDYKWYHPMLGGAGLAANSLENAIATRLGTKPQDMLSHQIYHASKSSAWHKGKATHSHQKLQLFYLVGYLVLTALVVWNLLDLNPPPTPALS